MKVMVDITRSSKTGIGKYSWMLLEQLSKLDTVNEYYGLTMGSFANDAKKIVNNVLLLDKMPETIEEIMHLSQTINDNVDLYISTSFSTFLFLEIRTIQVVHDLIYIDRVEWQPEINDLIERHGEKLVNTVITEVVPRAEKYLIRNTNSYQKLSQKSSNTIVSKIFNSIFSYYTNRADAIVAISQRVKKDIERLYPDFCKPIVVLYPPLPKYINNKINSDRRKNEVSILYVAAYEPRKNHKLLFDAISLIEETLPCKLELNLVGRAHYLSHYVKFQNLYNEFISNHKTKVNIYSSLTDHELSLVYRSADVFAYPSLSEGFGIPLIEAMQHQIPIVATPIETTIEVCGDSAHYSSNMSESGYAHSVKEVITSDLLRQELKSKQKKRLEALSVGGFDSILNLYKIISRSRKSHMSVARNNVSQIK